MIGLLDAYLFDEKQSFQIEYGKMFEQAIAKWLPGHPTHSYRVALGEWPKSATECDLWIISGSAKSCYEDLPWIHQLKDFVREVELQNSKMVGFCFGHQLIAEALGGKVEKSKKGWGIGVREVQVLKKQAWMNPDQDKFSLLYSHQDQVVALPEKADLFATSDFCPNEAFVVGESILTFQGHPEFSKEFAAGRYKEREKVIGEEAVNSALESFSKPISFDSIWSWVSHFSQ